MHIRDSGEDGRQVWFVTVIRSSRERTLRTNKDIHIFSHSLPNHNINRCESMVSVSFRFTSCYDVKRQEKALWVNSLN